ncbi:Cytochrome b5 reductase 4 [Trichoderma ghanense]|uniref:Cytochrome b5 reductase 4 n=1 Tax=Trichoderma ghanense TaxID=65468 RepID=A0ABY2HJN9_9HYPO
MALLGISLIVASFVFVALRQPQWLRWPWQSLGGGGVGAITDGKESQTSSDQERRNNRAQQNGKGASHGVAPKIAVQPSNDDDTALGSRGSSAASSTDRTSSTLRQRKPDNVPPSTLPTIQPPPTMAPTAISPPVIQEPESPTTPKAEATSLPQPVPSLSLADSVSLTMPPPPLPSSRPNGRIPALNQYPAPNSAQRARGPTPNRCPPAASSSSSSGLAPPPTHSSKPAKPSRQVVLTPGHSPLDWARISGPNSDLRGVAPSTPYLRVTPSMLKVQTGRKGKDAWMAINGKVYNVTPYAKFHPGGVPELMRGAGRDGTKLFGEIHPWVNYETMLAACLVGLLVDEPEGKESEMDRMD